MSRNFREVSGMAVYEIRRSGTVVARSTLPDLGYPARLLRQMEADGYTVCVDGKPRLRRAKKQEVTETKAPG